MIKVVFTGIIFSCFLLSGCKFSTPKVESKTIELNTDTIAPGTKGSAAALDTQWTSAQSFRIFKGKELEEIFFRVSFDKTYADFETAVYKGPKAALDYRSHPIAREYRTVITERYKNGTVNFAGHYILVSWGCGSPCVDFALVDVRTGKVYYPGLISVVNLRYKANSNLLVIGDLDKTETWYPTVNTFAEPPQYYLWKNNQAKLIWQAPKLPSK